MIMMLAKFHNQALHNQQKKRAEPQECHDQRADEPRRGARQSTVLVRFACVVVIVNPS